MCEACCSHRPPIYTSTAFRPAVSRQHRQFESSNLQKVIVSSKGLGSSLLSLNLAYGACSCFTPAFLFHRLVSSGPECSRGMQAPEAVSAADLAKLEAREHEW